MKTFSLVDDLKIGHIIEVAGATIQVELSSEVTELTRIYGGRVYPIGQIGSIVKVHFGRRLLFGYVTLLRMRSEEQPETTMVQLPLPAEQRAMQVELFAEGAWNSTDERLELVRGITTYPLPRQGVFLMTKEEVTKLYEAAEKQHTKGYKQHVGFAQYVGTDGVVCRADVDKMLGMHCAILGSTGSGKSGAVAVLLHSMLEHSPYKGNVGHPRIVLIDPHNEYGLAFEERAQIFRAYNSMNDETSPGQLIDLPYWLMSTEEFCLLLLRKTEREASVQYDIVRKALRHARMVAAKLMHKAPEAFDTPAPAADNAELERDRPLDGISTQQLAAFDVDKPRPFCLQEFHNHIRFIQAAQVSNSQLKAKAPSNTNSHQSVLDRLSVLRLDPRLQFLMKGWTASKPTLDQIIAQLVGALANEDGLHQDIRIIDISGLPNEVAGPLTAAIARLLFQYKLYQTVEERERDPIVLICEEAHRYVPDSGEAEYGTAQNAIKRIAREGRKYGISLMLVSQRPADIEGTVISQCGTWLVLRLTNSADQQQVARFLPDNLSGMTRALPTLGQQEALFVGVGAALPARIRVFDLTWDKLPRSSTVKFAHSWAQSRLSESELKDIAERMC